MANDRYLLQQHLDRLHDLELEQVMTRNLGRPFYELRDSGVLWLVNRVVFHPRGYALALHFSNENGPPYVSGGECTGWSLRGNGTEPWVMGDPSWEQQVAGVKTEDELFQLVKELMP